MKNNAKDEGDNCEARTPRFKRQGLKMVKKLEEERINHRRKYEAMKGIQKEMQRTNAIMDDMVRMQKQVGINETLYMALQYVPSGSQQHRMLTQKLTDAANMCTDITGASGGHVGTSGNSTNTINEERRTEEVPDAEKVDDERAETTSIRLRNTGYPAGIIME